MDCGTYIEKYLAAQVDGELGPDELRDAEAHLAGCAECRARFAEERAVKALLRERAQMLRTPAMVRGSILAALDAADDVDRRRGSDTDAARAARPRMGAMRRTRVWIPTALAAAALFTFVMLRHEASHAHPIPAFDVAIENYEHFVDRFEPNVPSDSPANISDAYMGHKLPGVLWNFQPSGYKLIGGRVDHLADGTPVSYTFYRSDSGSILCVYMKSHGLIEPPPGATKHIGGHSYYQYRGYSICFSYPRNDFICVLVSGRSMNQFVQDIVDSEY